MGFFMQRKFYLACYDIAEPKRQALFRHRVKRHSFSGQYSAYECSLSQHERQQLIGFMLQHAVLGEDGCAVVKVQSVYWQNLPKSPTDHASASNLFYIG